MVSYYHSHTKISYIWFDINLLSVAQCLCNQSHQDEFSTISQVPLSQKIPDLLISILCNRPLISISFNRPKTFRNSDIVACIFLICSSDILL